MWYKINEKDNLWWTDEHEEENGDGFYFSFDKKVTYSMTGNDLLRLSKKQIELIKEDNNLRTDLLLNNIKYLKGLK